MTSVVFDPYAQSEFIDAIRFYEEHREGLGRRFFIAMKTAVQHISKNPLLYRIRKAPFRRYRLSRFPYSIIYAIEPERIYIIALAHDKRKPEYWLKRSEDYDEE